MTCFRFGFVIQSFCTISYTSLFCCGPSSSIVCASIASCSKDQNLFFCRGAPETQMVDFFIPNAIEMNMNFSVLGEFGL